MRWMVLAVVLVGCDEELPIDTDAVDDDTAEEGSEADTDAGSDTEADTEADTESSAPVPLEGNWTTGELVVTNDPCNISEFQDPNEFLPDTLVVSNASVTGFAIGESGGASQDCTYTSPDFTCDRSTRREDTGVGAELILDQGLGGTVLSDVSIDAVLDLSATCDGAGCVLLELGGFVFPCAFEGTFDMDNP